MRILRALLVLGALVGPARAAEFAVTEPTLEPADGVISGDSRDSAHGVFSFSFEVNDTFVDPGTWELAQDGAAFVTGVVRSGFTISTEKYGLQDLPQQVANKLYTLTLRITDGSAGDTTSSTQSFDYLLTVDATRPVAPTGLVATSANRSAYLEWDVAAAGATDPADFESNIETYRVYYLAGDLAANLVTDGSASPTAISSSVLSAVAGIRSQDLAVSDRVNSMEIDGLTNGQLYSFVLVAIDHAGNDSGVALDDGNVPIVAYANPETYYSFGDLSGLQDRCFIVTAALNDRSSAALVPYRAFRDYVLLAVPGGESLVRWYYMQGPRWAYWLQHQPTSLRYLAWVLAWLGAVLLVLLPAALVILLARRVRHRPGYAALLLLWVLPQPAHAGHDWRDESETKVMRQHLRLSLSGFKPAASFVRPGGGSVVTFEELYGKKPTVLTRVGYGWEFFRYAGVLAAVADVGFWTQKGKSLDSRGLAHGGDLRDRMIVAPVSGGLQYALQYVFPQFVVPAVEAGVSIWAVSSTPPGTDVETIQDYRYGWYWQGELRLLLDWMDPPTSGQFNFDFGVMDTHLVVGWREDVVTNFGRAKKGFDLSNRTIYGSLLFQF